MVVQGIEAQHAEVAGRFERIGSLQRPLTPGVAAKARRESIYVDRRFSDHAPLTTDCDFAL